MRKRGISTVVATVLIILITLAAISIVWMVVGAMLRGNLDFGSTDAGVSIVTSGGYTFYDADTNIASVQVMREIDDVVMDRVSIIFSVDGNSFGRPVAAPASGSTKVYFFDLSGQGVPDLVSVAPVFVVGNKEKEGDVTSGVELDEGEVSLSANLNLMIFVDSLIDSDSWTIGDGSVEGYFANGGALENVREIGIGPYGDNVILWKAAPNGSNNADGGWSSAPISINHTKTYRSTVWIKNTVGNDGTAYFGASGSSTNYLDGNDNSNPYFWAGNLPELDKWYLLVAYIHGSGDDSMANYGGIYDGITGEKVLSITDYKNKVDATVQVHRAYLFYDVSSLDRQYFWNPTFTDVSGYELPLEV